MWKTPSTLWKSRTRSCLVKVSKIIVALVLLVVAGLVIARIYVGRFSPLADIAPSPAIEEEETVRAVQLRLNLPKSLVGEMSNDLTADINNLFSKNLGGEHREIEISVLKWKTKFFLISARGKKILDAIEGPQWGEDQGWFVGCEDKPENSPQKLENSVAFAGWENQQRKILMGWRVDRETGRFLQMTESDTQKIDCSKIPGWIEDFEDAEEEV